MICIKAKKSHKSKYVLDALLFVLIHPAEFIEELDLLIKLEEPLIKLGEPLIKLEEPLIKLGEPLTKLGEPLIKLGEN